MCNEMYNKEDLIYFGDNGLTSTSANHIANKAKETIKNFETRLQNISLYSTYLSTIDGNGNNIEIKKCFDETNIVSLSNDIEYISNFKALCAWLREAIKAKDRMTKTINSFTIGKWMKLNNIELNQEQEYVCHTFEDYLATLSIKERCRYYTVEAHCAAIGKFIHTDGAFYKARQEMFDKRTNPVEVKESENHIIVYKHEFPLSVPVVDDEFFKLNEKYRSYQAELNSIKHKGETWISQMDAEENAKNSKAYDNWKIQYEKATNEYREFLISEKKRVSNLKIVIPDDLKETYEYINKL